MYCTLCLWEPEAVLSATGMSLVPVAREGQSMDDLEADEPGPHIARKDRITRHMSNIGTALELQNITL